MIIKRVSKIENRDVLSQKVEKEIENIHKVLNSLGTTYDKGTGKLILTTDRGKIDKTDAYFMERVVKNTVAKGLGDAIKDVIEDEIAPLLETDTTPPDNTMCGSLSDAFQ